MVGYRNKEVLGIEEITRVLVECEEFEPEGPKRARATAARRAWINVVKEPLAVGSKYIMPALRVREEQ
jgi:hypothetical protein